MKAIQSKPQHVEVPVGFITRVREALAAGTKLSANTRYMICSELKAIEDGGYDYEVQPTRHSDTTANDVEVCSEHDATMWSVYRRPRIADEHGFRPAEWLADCKLRPHAESMRDALSMQQAQGV